MKYSAFEQFSFNAYFAYTFNTSTLIWLKMLTLNDNIKRRKHKQVLKGDA